MNSIFVSCLECEHHVTRDGMVRCVEKHTDVTDRGKLPCSTFEPKDDLDME